MGRVPPLFVITFDENLILTSAHMSNVKLLYLMCRFSLIVGFIVVMTVANCFAQNAATQNLDPKVFDSFLGTYRFPSGELIVIGRSQRRLYSYFPSSGVARGL